MSLHLCWVYSIHMYVCRVYNVQYVNISEFVTSEFSSYREETGSVTREFSSYRQGTGYVVHSASIEGSFDAPAIFCFLDTFFYIQVPLQKVSSHNFSLQTVSSTKCCKKSGKMPPCYKMSNGIMSPVTKYPMENGKFAKYLLQKCFLLQNVSWKNAPCYKMSPQKMLPITKYLLQKLPLLQNISWKNVSCYKMLHGKSVLLQNFSSIKCSCHKMYPL